MLVAALTAFGALFLLFCPLTGFGGISFNQLAFGGLVSGQMFSMIAQLSSDAGLFLIVLKVIAATLYASVVITIINLFRKIDQAASVFRWISLGIGTILFAVLLYVRIQLSQSLFGMFAGAVSLWVGLGAAVLVAAVILNNRQGVLPRVMYQIPGGSGRSNVQPPVSPRTSGSIVGTHGAFAGARFDLSGSPAVVMGRSPRESQIVFPSAEAAVSRKHVLVQFKENENGYTLTDYSRNGTYVTGGERLPFGQPYRVSRGAKLYLDKRGKNAFLLE